ncbi:type I secretion system permease/ATPase [Methylopila henanensis]|uniref:Type I secretion system permease/ATPase n=1 Tax=Methylopila henanensis TaxID=873516 RepID=A0ABW4K9V7_9HYPH
MAQQGTSGAGAVALARVRREIRPAFWLLAVFSIAINLLLLVPSLYMMQVYDRVLRSAVIETLVYITLIAAAAIAVYAALEAIRLRALARIGEWIEDTLFEPVFAAAMGAERGLVRQSGANEGTPFNDLRAVRSFLSGPTLPALCDTPWMPLFLVCCAVIHPYLGLLGLVFAVLIVALALLNDRLTRPAAEKVAAGHQEAQRVLAEAARNVDTVAAMGLGRPLAERASRANAASTAVLGEATDKGALMVGAGKFLRVVAQICTLALGAALSLEGHITPGGMIASSILLSRALAPLDQAIAAWRGLQQTRASWRRITALLGASGAMVEDPIALPAPEGRIALEGVVLMAAGSDKPILAGVSLAVAPGESLALIGPSGSGKSTLCRVMVGSRAPTRGVARLDGGDVMLWRDDQRRRHVGYLAQGTELFSGRVRDVIARFDEPDDARVVEAAKLVGCHEMVLGLPQGYDTELSNAGAFLSGGQRQRIALARAVYGDVRVVVMDEPNASLDGEGERALVGALAALKRKGVTVVLVTHKPALAQLCDRIGVMAAGQLTRLGPPTDILRELVAPVASADVRTMPGAAR